MAAARRRRAQAIFTDVAAYRDPESFGVDLGFRPERARIDADRFDLRAALGPELCIPSVAGRGFVLRLLRVARIAPPGELDALLEDAARVASLLERAVGTRVALSLRARTRVDWQLWTEEGIRRVRDISDVLETGDAYLVRVRGHETRLRFPRAAVVRQQSETTRWYEVLTIERP